MRQASQQQHDLSAELIGRFHATFERVPEWAWPFNPPVALVGSRYLSGEGLLIYASAENLSWLNDEPAPPARFTSASSWNRYRVWHQESGRAQPQFFPDVGIQPVSNGGLLAAGLFAADRLGLSTDTEPRAFLEKIAVSNWCKFAVRAPTNRDYIDDLPKQIPSLPYVVGELAVLNPAVVLVPQKVWQQRVLAAAMHGAAPWARFIPVPQFNATVVNCHLAKYEQAGRKLSARLAGTPLAEWMQKLRGVHPQNAWRYLARLAETLDQLPAARTPAK